MKKARVVESCLTLCDPMDYTVHGMLQAFSLLQGIFPTQGLIPGLPHCRRMLYQPSHREAQEYWNGEPIHSPGDLPNPGIEPGPPALQADPLPAGLPGKSNGSDDCVNEYAKVLYVICHGNLGIWTLERQLTELTLSSGVASEQAPGDFNKIP